MLTQTIRNVVAIHNSYITYLKKLKLRNEYALEKKIGDHLNLYKPLANDFMFISIY